ncbi:MAG: uridylate kinase, partial [Anaerolineae bacterium]|nr:uridylate kinase [Anaerolineae bacterium]
MITLLKLGGSLITDKQQSRTYLPDVMQRLAQEIQQARDESPELQLIVGHGSGSFGHEEAHKHGTMAGVKNPAQWHGFVQVAAVAASLSQLVTETLLQAQVPVFRIQPSASVIATDGIITKMS